MRAGTLAIAVDDDIYLAGAIAAEKFTATVVLKEIIGVLTLCLDRGNIISIGNPE